MLWTQTVTRSYLAPEVIQTSEMDCGPAALKCLLEGHGIPVSYGRLREACQTDLDGTSIDTLEQVAKQLGLDAEQVMIPLDHLLLKESATLPALLVIRLPSGATHFVVVWRRHGPLLQIMDPGTGRRWVSAHRFLEEVYVHNFQVPANDWYEWAKTAEFTGPLTHRLKDLGLGRSAASLVEEATARSESRELATLDAATRMMTSLVQSKALRRGREADRVLNSLLIQTGDEHTAPRVIPELFWSALPVTPHSDSEMLEEDKLQLQGPVLIRIRGRQTAPPEHGDCEQRLNPELAAAIHQPENQASTYLFRTLREDGALSIGLLAIGLLVAAAGVVFEAVLFRSAMEVVSQLRLVEQRLASLMFLVVFAVVMLAIEWYVGSGTFRLGRLLEMRLRLDFLKKIPRLNDRYFQSRPISDMAARSHNIHHLRQLPWLGGQLIRTTFTLVFTTLAVCWLFPAGAPIALVAGLAAVALPLIFRRRLTERDLRVRTHAGALSGFYRDALVGLAPIRSHTAERPIRREHEGLLVEWARASLQLVHSLVVMETLVTIVGFSLAALLIGLHFRRGENPAGALLLAYWALQLPILGDQLAAQVAQYPFHRNLVLRAVEPLGAPDEEGTADSSVTTTPQAVDEATTGTSLEFQSVTVRAAGHSILQDVSARIGTSEHVAIVGTSGAGKSSLIGLLLGWHRPASGVVLVDGEPLHGSGLDALRTNTAWVDPAIQLWNRSLVDNLLYGNVDAVGDGLDQLLRDSDLIDILPRLPGGMQTRLGGGGGLLSGGEGQRVRFGRLGRRHARLVLLDEPFRGLEHRHRQALLKRARLYWRDATLLCVTHDIEETLEFERVLVIDNGRIIEDGCPREFLTSQESRYRQLLDAHRAANESLWNRPTWRRIRLEDGRLLENISEAES